MDCSPPGSFVYGDSPDKNTGEGCHAILQGFFLTQGSNPGVLHCTHLAMHLTRKKRLRFNAVYEPALKSPTSMKEDTGV